MIYILLSTYCGSRFLGEFMDSLFAQDCDSFKLIVRDDGSTDTTISILEQYQKNIKCVFM